MRIFSIFFCFLLYLPGRTQGPGEGGTALAAGVVNRGAGHGEALSAGKAGKAPGPEKKGVLHADDYMHYIDSFNAEDRELYPQYIPNDRCKAFLAGNIPLFDCPDKQLEKTYYFRWWTYRKHIRKTPEGFVILEFLPDVEWAGKYNTINCAAGLHLYEGRWLHDPVYLDDYSKFWYRGGGDPYVYSSGMADAIWNRALVTGDPGLAGELEGDLINEYRQWEKERLDSNGLFWQEDGKDGMEVSIGGSMTGDPGGAGYRATINSYMYGNAMALVGIARLNNRKEVEDLFLQKAAAIRDRLLEKLWDDTAHFFKVMGRERDVLAGAGHQEGPLCSARELHGYTPWFFNIPSGKYDIAWKYLMDPHYFYAPYGPTTAEQGHPGFRVSYEGHECQWNGPSWPLSTSITLTGLSNLLNHASPSYITRKDYFDLLLHYARAHQRRREDGRIVSWVDENLNPFTGDWLSRTRLSTWENGHWSVAKGGEERGKDYNHSTFCDLVITGLVGLRPEAGDHLVVNPLIPAGAWDYFCLDNVLYHGHILTILYDRSGKRYHRGKGLAVYIDGKEAGRVARLGRLELSLGEKPGAGGL